MDYSLLWLVLVLLLVLLLVLVLVLLLVLPRVLLPRIWCHLAFSWLQAVL